MLCVLAILRVEDTNSIKKFTKKERKKRKRVAD